MSDGKFIIELMSVFNPDGILSAKKHLEEFKGTIAKTDLQDSLKGYAQGISGIIESAALGVTKPLVLNSYNNSQSGASDAYLRELQREELIRNAYYQTKQGRMMEYFFGSEATSGAELDTDPETDYRQRRLNNRAMLLAMKSDWIDYSRTISGGFMQAMASMEYSIGDWANHWTRMANSASGNAANAIKNFLDKSSVGFMNFGFLAQNLFDSILDAFLDMIAQMVARLAVLNLFKAVNIFSGGFLAPLLGAFETGGAVGATGPYLLHAGEYVLPASVVSAIKAAQAPSAGGGAAEFAAGSGGGAASGGAVFNISPVINMNAAAGQDDIKQLVRKITEATKQGVSWAVENAGVNYKVGRTVENRTLL